MNCGTAYSALLTADPHELRGLGDSELAQHIRSCAACRAKGERILDANALLAASLNQQSPVNPGARRPWAAAIPLALAAAISGVMLSSQPTAAPAPRVGSIAEVKQPVNRTTVNASAGEDVAVFRVSDKITVVWTLGAGGGS